MRTKAKDLKCNDEDRIETDQHCLEVSRIGEERR